MEDKSMSFKDQLEATVQEGRDCNAITAKVKKTLLDAAQNGESSVFLPLTDEYGYKVGVIRRFLENEDIKFKMIYDAKQIKRQNYYDRNKDKIIPNYTDTKYIFQGIRVFL